MDATGHQIIAFYVGDYESVTRPLEILMA